MSEVRRNDFQKNILITFGVVVMFLIGCREVHYYAYKAPTIEIMGGEFTVNLEGSYSENYEKDGKKMADWGFPYSLQFIFSVPKEHNLSKMAVKEISLTGENSGRSISLPNVESSKVRGGDEKLIRVSIGGIASDKYEYESYNLEATVIVYESDGIFKEEELSLRIETDYRKERRSDWFDEKTSI